MIMIPAQEVKRRGISAVDELLKQAPVHIIKNNTPQYVVLREEDYQIMIEDLALARVESSEADLQAGSIRKGNAHDLMNEIEGTNE